MPIRVLVVASECAPLVKMGGLGDVIGSLPPALRREGVDARVLLPGYPGVLAAIDASKVVATLPAWADLPEARVLATTLPHRVPLYVIDCPSLYVREGGPYQDAAGVDWPDNARRFALLARVAAAFGREGAPQKWVADVVHANDWQAGLAPAYLALGAGQRAATLFTVHNLAFQGLFDPGWLPALGLPHAAWSMHGVEYHDRLSFMKAGLYYADAISTVSPTYAREIQSPPLGMGFEGLLADRAHDLSGILNGIDDRLWNPRTDPLLASTYDKSKLARKMENRRALAARLGLAPHADRPLFGLVSRFTHQKGVDLVLDIADAIVELPAQVVLVGTGERELEARVRACVARHEGAIAAFVGFDETLAHLVEGGCDAFLMPSRFEPCGMNQMFSQRYGTPPIVHATGGLADSVADAADPEGLGTGFVFAPATTGALWAAIERAAQTWHDRDAWRALQRNGMAREFGWRASAKRYVELYQKLCATPRA